MAWEAKNDKVDMWLRACSGGIAGFLGPSYLSCCTSYLIDFDRSCIIVHIGCRLIVFRSSNTSSSPALPDNLTLS